MIHQNIIIHLCFINNHFQIRTKNSFLHVYTLLVNIILLTQTNTTAHAQNTEQLLTKYIKYQNTVFNIMGQHIRLGYDNH